MTALEIILIILIVLFVGGIVAWRVSARLRARKGKSAPSCGCGSGCVGSVGCSGCAAKCPSTPTESAADNDGMPPIAVRSTVTCDFSDITAKIKL